MLSWWVNQCMYSQQWWYNMERHHWHTNCEDHLLNYSQQHYSKQSSWISIYTRTLKCLLNYDRLTKFREDMFQGRPISPNINIAPMTHLFLQHQKGQLTTHKNIQHALKFDQLMQGFKEWPKWTSTSPSGSHLGIYKSQLKDFPPTPDKENSKPPERTYRIKMMQSMFQLLHLAIHHTHTYNWWKVIRNMFIKKDTGNPQLPLTNPAHSQSWL